MREIFNSHPVAVLKKEIAKTNIKGYSTMKKPQIVELMMKNKSRFSHIKMADKPVRGRTAKPQPSKKPTASEGKPAEKKEAPKLKGRAKALKEEADYQKARLPATVKRDEARKEKGKKAREEAMKKKKAPVLAEIRARGQKIAEQTPFRKALQKLADIKAKEKKEKKKVSFKEPETTAQKEKRPRARTPDFVREIREEQAEDKREKEKKKAEAEAKVNTPKKLTKQEQFVKDRRNVGKFSPIYFKRLDNLLEKVFSNKSTGVPAIDKLKKGDADYTILDKMDSAILKIKNKRAKGFGGDNAPFSNEEKAKIMRLIDRINERYGIELERGKRGLRVKS